MKKARFFILLLLGFALAFSDAGHAAVPEREALSCGQQEYISAEFSLPHTEIDVLTFHHNGISPVSHAVKKVHEVNGITVRVPVLFSSLFSYYSLVISGLYAKSYLDHIYPSHNFW